MNILENNDVSTSLTQSPTVLVTGGTGFIGAYVIRDLVKEGYKIKALRRRPTVPSFLPENIFEHVEWFDCDILDPAGLEDAMEGVEAVIHSAAVVSFNKNKKQQLFNTNIEGTANVVNAAIQKKVKRFIHVSSVAALGKKTNGSIITEKSTWLESKLNTNYAVSKHLGEMEAWRGIAEGLNGLIVNPSTVLGYGDWNKSSNALFRNIHDGFDWYTNGGTGFVDVEDVSRAIVQLLATNIRSERFILNGGNRSYRQVMDAIADGFKLKRPQKQATPFLAGLAWRLEKAKSVLTGKKILLTRESAQVAQTNTKFDNSKILKALPGFNFTNIEETIRRACGKYLNSE
jgi:dihydroflavonol-4-reductase